VHTLLIVVTDTLGTTNSVLYRWIIDTVPPQIEVRRLLNATLATPLPYYPGTWGKNIVIYEFACYEAPGIPAVRNTLPRKLTFGSDGIYTVGGPGVYGGVNYTYGCRDAAGNWAAPVIVTPETVMVDNKIPVCTAAVTPTTLKHGSGLAPLKVALTISDGVFTSYAQKNVRLQSIVSSSGGTVSAATLASWGWNTNANPASVSGRLSVAPAVGTIYTLTYSVTDQAGYTGTCKTTVRIVK
jgi:hypothetical protein